MVKIEGTLDEIRELIGDVKRTTRAVKSTSKKVVKAAKLHYQKRYDFETLHEDRYQLGELQLATGRGLSLLGNSLVDFVFQRKDIKCPGTSQLNGRGTFFTQPANQKSGFY